ncbi:hypothetical protein HMPREF3209_02222, partial [Lactobacillus crispatus]
SVALPAELATHVVESINRYYYAIVDKKMQAFFEKKQKFLANVTKFSIM